MATRVRDGAPMAARVRRGRRRGEGGNDLGLSTGVGGVLIHETTALSRGSEGGTWRSKVFDGGNDATGLG